MDLFEGEKLARAKRIQYIYDHHDKFYLSTFGKEIVIRKKHNDVIALFVNEDCGIPHIVESFKE